MAKAKFERTRKSVDIGILGHAGHGKTTLSEAIKKELELKERSNELKPEEIFNKRFQRIINIINSSGHTDNVKDMIAIAALSDGAILVVSADDGPMPQTREHLLLARQIGVPCIIVFINKIDRIDSVKIDEVEKEIKELLSDYSYEDSTIVKGSAIKAVEATSHDESVVCIDKLIAEIDKIPARPFVDLKPPDRREIVDYESFDLLYKSKSLSQIIF